MPNRRRFLAGMAVVVAADSLWGCASSGPSAQATAPASPDLDHFMSLSKLLSGYGDLDSSIGSTYLTSQRKDAARSADLDALFERSGIASSSPPSSLGDLAQRGVFSDPSSLEAASALLANWFSGSYSASGGAATATWNDALAWKACRFTKPPGMCGGQTGYWAKPPGPA